MVRAFWLSDLPLLLTVRSLCVPRCPPRLTAGLPGTGQSSQICVMEAVRVKFLIVDLWSLLSVLSTSLPIFLTFSMSSLFMGAVKVILCLTAPCWRRINVLQPHSPSLSNHIPVFWTRSWASSVSFASSVTSMLEMAPESIVVFQDSSLTKLSIVSRRLT